MAVAGAMVAGAGVVAEAVAEVAMAGTRMVVIATEVAGGLFTDVSDTLHPAHSCW